MKLKTRDLLKLELLKTKISLCAEAAQHRSCRVRVMELETAIKVRELNQEHSVIKIRKNSVEKELEDLVHLLSDKYGIDLKDRSYDDETGEIIPLGDDTDGDS